MAGEIAFDYATGKSCYLNIRNRTSGMIWNGAAFEVYSAASGNQSSYALAAVEQGAGGHYTASFPPSIPAGVYDVSAKQELGAFFAESDPRVAGGEVQWNGSIVPPLSDYATSGQLGQFGPLRPARGVMVKNWPIYFKSSADHITPFTSGVVSGQISRDGGTFGPLQSGAFSEIGLGAYALQAFTSGDLLCNTAMVVFSAAGVSGGSADPVPLGMVTQRTSGQ